MVKERNTKSKAIIRQMLEDTDLKFVMLNKRLFDDFLTVGKIPYKPRYNKDRECYVDYKGKKLEKNLDGHNEYATFNDKDLIVIILIKFLQQIDYRGYTVELAKFLGMKSDKRFKDHIKKLGILKGKLESVYRNKSKKVEFYPDGKQVNLITESKVEGYEEGKKRVFYEWYLNYDHEYKQVKTDEKINYVATDFFRVTIYDFDLYLNGTLNEKEFITYLYFIRAYNKDEKNIWHTINTLSGKVNIKNDLTTRKMVERFETLRIKDKFITEENEDFPLIHIDKPNNYDRKVLNREDPSCNYRPVYNLSTLNRLKGDNPNIYDKSDSKEVPQVQDEEDLSFLDAM